MATMKVHRHYKGVRITFMNFARECAVVELSVLDDLSADALHRIETGAAIEQRKALITISFAEDDRHPQTNHLDVFPQRYQCIASYRRKQFSGGMNWKDVAPGCFRRHGAPLVPSQFAQRGGHGAACAPPSFPLFVGQKKS